MVQNHLQLELVTFFLIILINNLFSYNIMNGKRKQLSKVVLQWNMDGFFCCGGWAHGWTHGWTHGWAHGWAYG